MTTVEDLARTIQTDFGIDSYGAALSIVGVHLNAISDDPDLYNQDTRELTDLGADMVTEAVAATDHNGWYGTRTNAILEAVAETTLFIREKTAERDSLIRAAMKTEIPRGKIAEAADLSEARLYQIRDGRR